MSSHESEFVPSTERTNPASRHLSRMTALEALHVMAQADVEAVRAVDAAAPAIAAAADRFREAMAAGARAVFLGAGTSGRLAVQEVAELPQTFGLDEDRLAAIVASRVPFGRSSLPVSEDDAQAAVAAIDRLALSEPDIVVGIAASGRTPFVCGGMASARLAGAYTVGIANNSPSELLEIADTAIFLDTGPEVVTGSTRLKAGTSQKLALNRLTTVALARSGRVTGHFMTELRATNTKLRSRATRMIETLTGLSEADARRALEASGWHVGVALRRLGFDDSPDRHLRG